jgi:hypothetical protein
LQSSGEHVSVHFVVFDEQDLRHHSVLLET